MLFSTYRGAFSHPGQACKDYDGDTHGVLPDCLFDRSAVLPSQLTHIPRLPGSVKQVRQVRELHAQHRIRGGQERCT